MPSVCVVRCCDISTKNFTCRALVLDNDILAVMMSVAGIMLIQILGDMLFESIVPHQISS